MSLKSEMGRLLRLGKKMDPIGTLSGLHVDPGLEWETHGKF